MNKCPRSAGQRRSDGRAALDPSVNVRGQMCTGSDISPGLLIIHVLGGTAPLKTAAEVYT